VQIFFEIKNSKNPKKHLFFGIFDFFKNKIMKTLNFKYLFNT